MDSRKQRRLNVDQNEGVKICLLTRDGQWEYLIGGRVFFAPVKLSGELGLFVIDADNGELCLVHRISPDNIYLKEDKKILWEDQEGSSKYALYFEDTSEFSRVWGRIIDIHESLLLDRVYEAGSQQQTSRLSLQENGLEAQRDVHSRRSRFMKSKLVMKIQSLFNYQYALFFPFISLAVMSYEKFKLHSVSELLVVDGGFFGILVFIFILLCQERGFFRRGKWRVLGAVLKGLVIVVATRGCIAIVTVQTELVQPPCWDRFCGMAMTVGVQLALYVGLLYQEQTAEVGLMDSLYVIAYNAAIFYYKEDALRKDLLQEGITWAALLIKYMYMFYRSRRQIPDVEGSFKWKEVAQHVQMVVESMLKMIKDIDQDLLRIREEMKKSMGMKRALEEELKRFEEAAASVQKLVGNQR